MANYKELSNMIVAKRISVIPVTYGDQWLDVVLLTNSYTGCFGSAAEFTGQVNQLQCSFIICNGTVHFKHSYGEFDGHLP